MAWFQQSTGGQNAECKCISMAEERKRDGIIFSILKKGKSDTCYKDKP